MILQQDIQTASYVPRDVWHLQAKREICSDVQAGLDHEWLVTNGLGGYAAGSLVGATTRSYHGLLVAALHPPVERIVLVTKVDEVMTLPNKQTLQLGVSEYQDGIIYPQGYTYLQSVALEGDLPCFTYRLSETLLLEKRVWMEYGQNTTYVQYVLRGTLESDTESALLLEVQPFCLARDYHATTQGVSTWRFLVENQGNRCRVQATPDSPACMLVASPAAAFISSGQWYWHILHRRDRERGLPDCEDVYQPGIFRLPMTPGTRVTLVLSAEPELARELGGPQHEEIVAQALMRHQRRIKQLLAVANHSHDDLQLRDPVRARLVMAADQFIVARPDYGKATPPGPGLRLSPDCKTIIAGYPWFTDWGRDSMIALPGLLLTTGRYSEARGLLRAFLSFVCDGLIPNRFPDRGEEPEYNTVDATLWMFYAINRYLAVKDDGSLLKEIYPVLSDIVQSHIRGTIYGIGVDPEDGLLHAGASGVQLTWMDAKVGDWVVTPRRGKPVEINALWYYVLTSMESWAVRLSIDAAQYAQLRTQVRQNFAARFWYEEGGYLYDVVDVDGVPGQNDASLRPNQLFAASLTSALLSEVQVVSMFQQVTEHLLTPVGLRSLSPTDPEYYNKFNGDRRQRDSAYHQGAAWQWLIGPYADVYLRVKRDRAGLRQLLQPLVQQLWHPCLGTISEVSEPEAPFTPSACFAQAWSVAELLRCWVQATEG